MILRTKHCVVFAVLAGLLLSLVTFLKLYNPVVSIVLKSTQFSGQVVLGTRQQKELVKELAKAKTSFEKSSPKISYYLIIKRKQGIQRFQITENNLVYDFQGSRVQASEKFFKILTKAEKGLRRKSPYGEMVDWAQADKLFPRMAKAEVQDVDTGLSFWVQRRAGSAHADVQPLTAEDSAIMRTIYNGRWSWKRKAILVKVNGRKLAASMNGMPHGAGAICGNDFDGHFCIHFFNSKTHTGPVNLEHQIMVWKAAGRFEEMTRNLSPKKTIEVLFTAVDQEELTLASHFYKSPTREQKSRLTGLLKPIQWVTLKKVQISKDSEEKVDKQRLFVSLEMGLPKVGQTSREGFIDLVKVKGSPRWQVEPQSLLELLEGFVP